MGIRRVIVQDFANQVRQFVNEENVLQMTFGRGSYLVEGSLEYFSDKDHVLVGSYCSIAHDVKLVLGLNHDYKKVSTAAFDAIFHMNMVENPQHVPNHHQLRIGHDVWIGRGCTLLSGITIGNGAVIGAGSVVTKDIPPYAVAAGNPCRVLKYRFEEAVIARLQKLKWWYWPEEKLVGAVNEMGDVESFLEKYMPTALAEPLDTELGQSLADLRQQGKKLFCLLMEVADTEMLWLEAAQRYIQERTAVEDVVLLLLSKAGEQLNGIDTLIEALAKKGDMAPALFTYEIQQDGVPLDALANIDVFVTTKSFTAMQYLDYASDYGARVVYAGDDDAFWL